MDYKPLSGLPPFAALEMSHQSFFESFFLCNSSPCFTVKVRWIAKLCAHTKYSMYELKWAGALQELNG